MLLKEESLGVGPMFGQKKQLDGVTFFLFVLTS